MWRATLLLAWFGLVFIAAFALTPVGILRGTEVASELGALLSLAGALGLVLVFLLADRNWLGDLILRGPFTKAALRRMLGSSRREAHAVRKSVLAALARSTAVGDLQPGSVLAEVVARLETLESRQLEPDELRAHRNWLHHSVRRSRDSALGRLLIPSRALELAELADNVVTSLDEHLFHEVVGVDEITRVPVLPGQEMRFSDFVTAFTGAVVLGDATQTRSGLPASIRTWHSRGYQPSENPDARYSDHHAHDPALPNDMSPCVWDHSMRSHKKSRADDYDGRVLDLRRVDVVRDRRNGFVELRLMTGESCYAATEVSPRKCKALRMDDDSQVAPRWGFSDDALSARREDDPDGMLTLLTAVATVILVNPSVNGTQRTVVFTQRASGLRNGGDVLSVTGGGVMNLSIEGHGGDEDQSGTPDPAIAVVRELREEVGLDLEPGNVIPLSVYLLNERGPQIADRTASGQVVATAAYMAVVPVTSTDLESLRLYASSHNGLYESDGFEYVSLPAVDGVTVADKALAAGKFAESLLEIADRLDQRAILSALYISAAQYSAAATVQAFTKVWDRPWFQYGWSTELESGFEMPDRLARKLSEQLDAKSYERVEKLGRRLWQPEPHSHSDAAAVVGAVSV